jgi:hypothetical protein
MVVGGGGGGGGGDGGGVEAKGPALSSPGARRRGRKRDKEDEKLL